MLLPHCPCNALVLCAPQGCYVALQNALICGHNITPHPPLPPIHIHTHAHRYQVRLSTPSVFTIMFVIVFQTFTAHPPSHTHTHTLTHTHTHTHTHTDVKSETRHPIRLYSRYITKVCNTKRKCVSYVFHSNFTAAASQRCVIQSACVPCVLLTFLERPSAAVQKQL